MPAATSYQHALVLHRDLGHHYHEATTLVHLGDTHRAADNPHAARIAWQLAVTILDRLHHPDADSVRTKLANLTNTTSADRTPIGQTR